MSEKHTIHCDVTGCEESAVVGTTDAARWLIVAHRTRHTETPIHKDLCSTHKNLFQDLMAGKLDEVNEVSDLHPMYGREGSAPSGMGLTNEGYCRSFVNDDDIPF